MVNEALDQVICMREDNEDVFPTPPILRSCYFTEEEIQEFYRAWEAVNDNQYLRGNPQPDIDLYMKMQLEWGQALMMLLTCAMHAKINPDLALHMAIEVVYERCERKRRELNETRV